MIIQTWRACSLSSVVDFRVRSVFPAANVSDYLARCCHIYESAVGGSTPCYLNRVAYLPNLDLALFVLEREAAIVP